LTVHASRVLYIIASCIVSIELQVQVLNFVLIIGEIGLIGMIIIKIRLVSNIVIRLVIDLIIKHIINDVMIGIRIEIEIMIGIRIEIDIITITIIKLYTI